MAARTTTGIRARHSRSCKSASDGACNCRPTWEASVYLKREGRKVRKTFPTQAAAKAWRADAEGAKNRGKLRGPTALTVRQAAEAFMAEARGGAVFARGGRPYKPGTLRTYDAALDGYVLPALGHLKVSQVTRDDVEALVKAMRARGVSASSIHNTLDPLRVIFRRAIRADLVAADPTKTVELGKQQERRERIAEPPEMRRLLQALPASQRALWAMAAYAGLRRRELRALLLRPRPRRSPHPRGARLGRRGGGAGG
jgi:integrase